MTTAKTLLEKEDVTSQEVDEQLLKLNAAMEGLVEKADKGVLQEAYDEAVKITNDANYPGWDNLQAVIAAAGGVLADENASQKDADDAANALNAAISNLNGSVDKSVLNSLIEEAKALDTAGYTEASIASFEAAIASAQSVLTDAGASQSDVDKQILLLQKAAEALIQKAQDNVVYDGIYTIDGRIWHASSDQASMGNAALKKPMQVVVKTDEETGETKATLRMEFGPLTTSLGATDFTGYLAELYYFPGWEGGESGYQMPSGETPVAANIESYYEDTYDVYNHPETGTDANVKGKLYPHIMNIPVELGDNEIWVQGLDGGKLSLEEAIHQYELKYPDDVDVMGWFLRNGEQMAVKRPEVWDKVAALKEKGYKIYLLSNYSEELFHVHTKGAKFLNVLDGGVVSYQVHALKPDREIYEILLKKYSLKAEECLFFDDRMDNVEGAKKAGIHAIQVTSREMLNETLDKMLTK